MRPQQPKFKFSCFWRTSASCFITGAWFYKIRQLVGGNEEQLKFLKAKAASCKECFTSVNAVSSLSIILTALIIFRSSRLGADLLMIYSFTLMDKTIVNECNVTDP